jgi:hypothetical protein
MAWMRENERTGAASASYAQDVAPMPEGSEHSRPPGVYRPFNVAMLINLAA